jgi:DNA repair photolyase
LLAAAAQQGLVRVNLSIGTLDDEVWRTTEPGTPHPRRRVEAVRKLNDAGVPCGVLVAPVLPGLSDRADQLDDVVTACVEAGAVSISPVLLHLRPGVKDVYYDRLRANHPQLMPRYEHLYGDRSYAPKAEQRRVADLVHELVRRRQGRLQSFGETPMPGPSRGSSRAAPARADPGASDVPVQQSLL